MKKMVIEIPEETYQDIIKNGFIYDEDNEVITHAIKNGTVLSKGYGNLIEADRLKEVFMRNTGYDYHDLIDIAPIIIEADKTEEKGKKIEKDIDR